MTITLNQHNPHIENLSLLVKKKTHMHIVLKITQAYVISWICDHQKNDFSDVG